MADANDEKYVTRREYHEDQRKNAERHHQHDIKFIEMQGQNNRMLSDLNELPGTIKQLKSTLTKLGGRIDDTEYDYKDLDTRVTDIETATEGKKKHNTQIILGIIAAFATIGAAALAFAQVFFQ